MAFAHPGERLELGAEDLRVADVAETATEADHRVLFSGLERLTARQATKLVGPEVRCAVNDRARVEGRGDPHDRGRQAVDELSVASVGQELARVRVLQR